MSTLQSQNSPLLESQFMALYLLSEQTSHSNSHAAQRLGWPDDDETPKSHLTRVSWMAHVKQTIHARFGFHDTTSRGNPHDYA